MKAKKAIVFTLLAALLMSTVACGGGGREVASAVNASFDDFRDLQHISKAVEVAVGDSLAVTLYSNPSTGFAWSESARISDQSVLRQTEHKYVAPAGEDDKPPAPGTPGREVWTFKALKKGTAEVSTEYSQPWEGGQKAEWTYVLTVVVR